MDVLKAISSSDPFIDDLFKIIGGTNKYRKLVHLEWLQTGVGAERLAYLQETINGEVVEVSIPKDNQSDKALYKHNPHIMASAAGHASKFQRFLNSETGPRTVHFWAPVFKWSLVIAGLNDIQRPVEKLSGTQQLALFATGAIWTRWAGFAIKPRNYLLASVNFFLGGVAGYQLIRIVNYRRAAGDNTSQVFHYIFNGEAAADAQPVPAKKA